MKVSDKWIKNRIKEAEEFLPISGDNSNDVLADLAAYKELSELRKQQAEANANSATVCNVFDAFGERYDDSLSPADNVRRLIQQQTARGDSGADLCPQCGQRKHSGMCVGSPAQTASVPAMHICCNCIGRGEVGESHDGANWFSVACELCKGEGKTLRYVRRPTQDKRIGNGDDFAGDAWFDQAERKIVYGAVGVDRNAAPEAPKS